MPDLTIPPTPPTPPTPPYRLPVPLAALLAREDLGLRQIAGPTDPDIVIHWAHTSEMPDPVSVSAGRRAAADGGRPHPGGGGLRHVFRRLRLPDRRGGRCGPRLRRRAGPRHRAEGPGRGLGDHYDLPLLEVPPPTPFSRVARAVWQLMAQARLAELRRVTEAQQSLAAAASRPDPVPSVLRQLAQRVGGRAVLYGPGRHGDRGGGAGRDGADATAGLAELARVVRPTETPSSAAPPPPPPTPSPAPISRPTPWVPVRVSSWGRRPAPRPRRPHHRLRRRRTALPPHRRTPEPYRSEPFVGARTTAAGRPAGERGAAARRGPVDRRARGARNRHRCRSPTPSPRPRWAPPSVPR
ncbi:hypothetical protein ACRAWF_35170 [Streptomyces sp. L7]